jgi:hypothetical protein
MDREMKHNEGGFNRYSSGHSSASASTQGDKRRFLRMKMIMGMLCYRVAGPPANVFTDDVSLGGIKFTTSVVMERNEDVELDVPVGGGRYQRIRGRIAWIKKGVMNNFEGGIEFGRMDEETKKAWSKFIERNAEKES